MVEAQNVDEPLFENESWMTKFVGRKEEQAQLEKLVASNRLVSVVGIGGVGKTRLVSEFVKSFPNALFVELESVDVVTVGDLLDQTLGNLRSSRDTNNADFVLVLDNAEHVLETVIDRLDELLEQSRKIVITSREPVGHSLERVMRLLPFDREKSDQFLREILTHRNLAIEDELSSFNYHAIHSWLDGLPLALEIVAPKLSLLGFDEQDAFLAKQVFGQHPDSSDSHTRHHSLQNTFDWSWDSLSAAGQATLSRCAMFSIPFERLAAIEVCDLTADEVDSALRELMTKSLLRRETVDGSVRFRMLYAIRTAATEKLQPDERSNTLNKIANWYSSEMLSETRILRRKKRHLWLPFKSLLQSPELSPDVRRRVYRALLSLETTTLDSSFREDIEVVEEAEVTSPDALFIRFDHAAYLLDFDAMDRDFDQLLAIAPNDHALLVDVAYRLPVMRSAAVEQIERLEICFTQTDDHLFSFWLQKARVLWGHGLKQDAEKLFGKAREYAVGRTELHEQLVVTQGLVAWREGRFEDAAFFFSDIPNDSGNRPSRAYYVGILRRLERNREALALAKPLFELVFEEHNARLAYGLGWNLYLLTGSTDWLKRALSICGSGLDASCLLYLGLTEVHTDPRKAAEIFVDARVRSFNFGQEAMSLSLLTLLEDENSDELDQLWSDAGYPEEAVISREVIRLMHSGSEHEIADFLAKQSERTVEDVRHRRLMYEIQLADFDIGDAWTFLLTGRDEKPTLRIDVECNHCQLPNGEKLNLSRRGPMKKILRALIEAQADDRTGLTTWQTMEVGWPDDKVRGDAAIALLYTTINNLRKLGFRDIVETTDDGYRISPSFSILIE